MMLLLPLALLASPSGEAPPLRVLVFGDSWGSYGPSWKTLERMFAVHGVNATVRSAAVAGTRACQWAEEPTSLRDAAVELFGGEGVDFVWYTLGGNDLGSDRSGYVACSKEATAFGEAMDCIRAATDLVTRCTDALLSGLWEEFPAARVMQSGYDLPCYDDGPCTRPTARFVPFCGANATCKVAAAREWAPLLLDPLAEKYPGRYAGVDVLGTLQAAGGVAGASPGHPVPGRGSPCELVTGCVHPTVGGAGADAIGEVFWEAYFRDRVLSEPEGSAKSSGKRTSGTTSFPSRKGTGFALLLALATGAVLVAGAHRAGRKTRDRIKRGEDNPGNRIAYASVRQNET